VFAAALVLDDGRRSLNHPPQRTRALPLYQNHQRLDEHGSPLWMWDTSTGSNVERRSLSAQPLDIHASPLSSNVERLSFDDEPQSSNAGRLSSNYQPLSSNYQPLSSKPQPRSFNSQPTEVFAQRHFSNPEPHSLDDARRCLGARRLSPEGVS
jgi:hypothetical protein